MIKKKYVLCGGVGILILFLLLGSVLLNRIVVKEEIETINSEIKDAWLDKLESENLPDYVEELVGLSSYDVKSIEKGDDLYTIDVLVTGVDFDGILTESTLTQMSKYENEKELEDYLNKLIETSPFTDSYVEIYANKDGDSYNIQFSEEFEYAMKGKSDDKTVELVNALIKEAKQKGQVTELTVTPNREPSYPELTKSIVEERIKVCENWILYRDASVSQLTREDMIVMAAYIAYENYESTCPYLITNNTLSKNLKKYFNFTTNDYSISEAYYLESSDDGIICYGLETGDLIFDHRIETISKMENGKYQVNVKYYMGEEDEEFENYQTFAIATYDFQYADDYYIHDMKLKYTYETEETSSVDVIYNTWYTVGYDTDLDWATSYCTTFYPNGTVEQRGYRNWDKGTYVISDDGKEIIATYNENYYDYQGFSLIEGYTYQVIYTLYDGYLYADYSEVFEDVGNSNVGDGKLYLANNG